MPRLEAGRDSSSTTPCAICPLEGRVVALEAQMHQNNLAREDARKRITDLSRMVCGDGADALLEMAGYIGALEAQLERSQDAIDDLNRLCCAMEARLAALERPAASAAVLAETPCGPAGPEPGETPWQRGVDATPTQARKQQERPAAPSLSEQHADFIKRWYKDVFEHGYKHGMEAAAPAPQGGVNQPCCSTCRDCKVRHWGDSQFERVGVPCLDCWHPEHHRVEPAPAPAPAQRQPRPHIPGCRGARQTVESGTLYDGGADCQMDCDCWCHKPAPAQRQPECCLHPDRWPDCEHCSCCGCARAHAQPRQGAGQ
jgi:hypothetical protein